MGAPRATLVSETDWHSEQGFGELRHRPRLYVPYYSPSSLSSGDIYGRETSRDDLLAPEVGLLEEMTGSGSEPCSVGLRLVTW